LRWRNLTRNWRNDEEFRIGTPRYHIRRRTRKSAGDQVPRGSRSRCSFLSAAGRMSGRFWRVLKNLHAPTALHLEIAVTAQTPSPQSKTWRKSPLIQQSKQSGGTKPKKTERPGFDPALLPHSTLRTVNSSWMRRRRQAPASHTRSSYCDYTSSTRQYLTRDRIPNQSPVLVTRWGHPVTSVSGQGSTRQSSVTRCAKGKKADPNSAATAGCTDVQTGVKSLATVENRGISVVGASPGGTNYG
jgi:hypothetical protein